MIHMLLLILKIIGIILLAVLALCLLVLFFPVTYKVKGDFQGKDFHITVQCGWLFHLLHFGGKFSNDESAARIRIFGIPINLLKDKSESDRKINLTKEKKKSRYDRDKSPKQERTETKDEKITNEVLKEKQEEHVQITDKCRENQSKDKRATEKEQDKSFTDKVKDIFRRICGVIRKVKDVIKKVYKDVEGIYNKGKKLKAFLTANTTKEAYRYGKGIIIKAVKHVFPTGMKAKIHFGFEQPDITGKVLGYIAMVFSVFQVNVKHISIIPDFDKKIFEGNIKLKGHFFMGILLIYILKFYFKKEIHDLIKRFI